MRARDSIWYNGKCPLAPVFQVSDLHGVCVPGTQQGMS
jgi:hypothetical protein